ncbi:unnamed protein product [Moneuplotes crassus]|uniref:Uncharacterized protein n=1 Tax=Euplotes crassus TaxID=5936 RepID=A0AAD1XUC1_EUPCR|nr:unnamed protein product [Moneuplotes crassus]
MEEHNRGIGREIRQTEEKVSKEEKEVRKCLYCVKFDKYFGEECDCEVFDPVAYSADLKFVEDCGFHPEPVDRFDRCVQAIFVSEMRSKSFYKMIKNYSKNQNEIEIFPIDNPNVLRQSRALKCLINNIHSLQRLTISCLRITSKQFVQILLSGIYLEKLKLDNCDIKSSQISLPALQRSSQLKIIIFKCGRISVQNEIALGTSHYSHIFHNISQCPCSQTLTHLLIQRSSLDDPLTQSLTQEHPHLPIKFTIGTALHGF